MPIITTFDNNRSSFGDGQSPKSARADMNCPTISPTLQLRARAWVPVWQNQHVNVHPTWDERQTAPRSASGI